MNGVMNMSLYVDKKFLGLVSPRLERFHQKSEYLWNFRCPICGDSKKNKLKTRGYVYRHKASLFFYCQNCSASMPLGKLIKVLDYTLFDEYRLENMKEDGYKSHKDPELPDLTKLMVKPEFKQQPIKLPTIASLPPDHVAKALLIRRKVPSIHYDKLYYAHDFASFVRELVPSYDKTLKSNDARIVIPFYDENKNLLGIQGRELSKTGLKYITIKVSDDARKVYGLERVDKSKRIYVVEGPIDSLFLDNAIATMDPTLYHVVTSVGNHDYVFVFDNEPRNSAICKLMSKTINMGHNVCIWPQNIEEKDVNDMVLSGLTGAEVQNIIDKNTFNDLRAKLEFGKWKRV
jgi:hypothetical protein